MILRSKYLNMVFHCSNRKIALIQPWLLIKAWIWKNARLFNKGSKDSNRLVDRLFYLNLVLLCLSLTWQLTVIGSTCEWFRHLSYPCLFFLFQELDANEKRVDLVNDLGSKLIDKGHINSDEIGETTNRLNTR